MEICEIEFVYDLNTNGTQTKIKKGTKRSKNSRFKQLKRPKIKKQSSQIKGLLWIVDNMDEHDLTKHV